MYPNVVFSGWIYLFRPQSGKVAIRFKGFFVNGLIFRHKHKKYLADAVLWRHNGGDGVSNQQPHDCLLNRSFRRRSKKTSKLRVTGLCEGNSPETGEFPAQMASNAENVSIWWRHHATDSHISHNSFADHRTVSLTSYAHCLRFSYVWYRSISFQSFRIISPAIGQSREYR